MLATLRVLREATARPGQNPRAGLLDKLMASRRSRASAVASDDDKRELHRTTIIGAQCRAAVG